MSCGPSPQPPPRTEAAEPKPSSTRESSARTAPEGRSQTSDWHEVQALESSNSGTETSTSHRKSHVVVSAGPVNQSLHFRFLVNGIPISGVFVAPSEQTTTFTIPVGTVHFTVDECTWEAQGFELAPDEDMPVSCKASKEGACCEVAIPIEQETSGKTRKQ